MDRSVLSPLLKLYEDAFDTRDEEHLWYHFWSEVFVHLNERTRNPKQSLSIAPQRRYALAAREADHTATLGRDTPVLTRSQNAPDEPHTALPEDEDEDDPMADTSFESWATSELIDSEEMKIRYRTPDFSIFQYLDASGKLAPRAIIENKPLELIPADDMIKVSLEEIKKRDLAAFFREWYNCRSQVWEQLSHLFADYTISETVVFVIIGGRYSVHRVTRDNFRAVLSDSGGDIQFVFDDNVRGLNSHLIAIWDELAATD